MNNYAANIFNKKLGFFFFQMENIRILLILLEHYTLKMDIIKYYSLPNCIRKLN